MSIRRSIIVMLGAIVLSTIGIQASDILRSIDGGLAGAVFESGSVCGAGAVQVNLASGSLCVDEYENTPVEACGIAAPFNVQSTQQALNVPDCRSHSVANEQPWSFVSMAEAQQLCARSGKRLPTASEWYDLAVSMTDTTLCVTEVGGAALTGTASCVSVVGIHDLVGNVWEWIDGEVVDGQYNNRELPERGYVAAVDSDGIVVETSVTGKENFGLDYAVTNTSGVFGILRGGYYDSGTDAGIFSQNLAVPMNLKTEGIGFRCVRSL